MSWWRNNTYCSKDRNSFFAEPHWIEDVVMENRLKQVIFIICFERRLSGHHFIHQHPQGPPVHRSSILQLLQDLDSTTWHGSERRTKQQLNNNLHLKTQVHWRSNVCSPLMTNKQEIKCPISLPAHPQISSTAVIEQLKLWINKTRRAKYQEIPNF